MIVIVRILGILALLLPVILIVGLIKPSRVLIWNKKPTRLKVTGWWMLITFLYMIGFGILVQNVPTEEMIGLATIDIDEGRYSSAIRQLKDIKEQDSLYAIAQELISKAERLIKKEIISSSTKDIDEGKYDDAVKRLETITPITQEDSLYAIAQELIAKAAFFSDLKKANLTILTITDLQLLDSQLSHGRARGMKIVFTDEEINSIVIPDNVNSWFDNISSVETQIPAGTVISFGSSHGFSHLSIMGKVVFKFVYNLTDYSINIGIGDHLIVKKTDKGTYKLFPDETVEYNSGKSWRMGD